MRHESRVYLVTAQDGILDQIVNIWVVGPHSSEGHPRVGVLREPDGGDVREDGRAVVDILQAEADLAAGGLGRLSLPLDGNHRHLEFPAVSLPVQLAGEDQHSHGGAGGSPLETLLDHGEDEGEVLPSGAHVRSC